MGIAKIAMQNHIGFVTPTNLITVLRMAESLWLLINKIKMLLKFQREQACLLYKFVGLQEDLTDH